MATENEVPGDKPEGESTPAPEKPSYMTAVEFNKASLAREKKLLDRFEKLLDDRFTKHSAAKSKATEEPEEEPEEPKDSAEEPKDGKSETKGSSDATAKQIASLQRQLTRERNEREKEKAERDAQAAKISRDEERSKLSETLATLGVKNVRGAVALLHTEDKRVRRNAEGKVVYFDENDDEFELGAGLKQWLSSDEGKSYMPPRGAGGAGTERGSAPRVNGKTKVSNQEFNSAIMSLWDKGSGG